MQLQIRYFSILLFIQLNANSTYPLVHEAMLPLIARWLTHKRLYGSAVEKALYKNITLIEFIHRLLEKRAVYFYGSNDRWKLIDNKCGIDGWDSIGTNNEKEPLVNMYSFFNQIKEIFYKIII